MSRGDSLFPRRNSLELIFHSGMSFYSDNDRISFALENIFGFFISLLVILLKQVLIK